MKKKFKIENLGCGSCAEKMQEGISKIDGVQSVNLNFIMQRLTIEAEEGDFERIIPEAQKIVSKIEPDSVIVAR
ncbi:MAG: cation transporter [Tissierellia bacterium]|nr:cation transporter [Tissierellia bacterium]